MVQLNINTDKLVQHTNTLEKMHRSALPVAIRLTLNRAAFDVKQRTMPAVTAAEFEKRKPNFFKANSRVQMATGFNVSTMKAIVGFVSLGGRNKAVDELEQQERGGNIEGRSFIPLKGARVGKNDSKMVKAPFRITGIENILDASKVNSTSRKQRFIKAAFKAKKLHGDNAFVLGNYYRGRRTLSKIDAVSSKKGKLSIRRTALFTYKKGFAAPIKRTDFMRRASEESGLNLDKFFIQEGQKQIQRLIKK